MPTWDTILKEIAETPSSIDQVRKNHLSKLSEYTGRNTIAYYSGWLQEKPLKDLDINDNDMNGFMNALNNLTFESGLDLILHTPGGSPVAAEAIVNYLRSKFGTNVRVIVPQLSMSAGTMIACSANIIIMGKHSSLGPIDPQINGIPAYNIVEEFEKAKEELKNNENLQYWSMCLSKYPPAFVLECVKAINLSSDLLTKWTKTGMGLDDKTVDNIVSLFNEHKDSMSHGRHFDIEFCKNSGLKIFQLEDDQKLQDLVLSVHHCFMQTFSECKCSKIIENNLGKAYISHH